ncbi:MAG: hypothetical protein K9M81_05110 [Chthoniobacterales bacterium]|nr:hypothetical protein [Chthoniobacterales bacterium]
MIFSLYISYQSPTEAGKPAGCCVGLELLLRVGGRDSYSRREISSLALPHQPSRPPRHDQYEISGLVILKKV